MEKHQEVQNGNTSAFPDPHLKRFLLLLADRRGSSALQNGPQNEEGSSVKVSRGLVGLQLACCACLELTALSSFLLQTSSVLYCPLFLCLATNKGLRTCFLSGFKNLGTVNHLLGRTLGRVVLWIYVLVR